MCRMISLLPSIHISEQYDSMEETVPQYTKVSKMIFKYFSIKKSPTFLVHATIWNCSQSHHLPHYSR